MVFSSGSSPSLLSLSPEIIHQILVHLDPVDVASVGQVSWAFAVHVDPRANLSLWKDLFHTLFDPLEAADRPGYSHTTTTRPYNSAVNNTRHRQQSPKTPVRLRPDYARLVQQRCRARGIVRCSDLHKKIANRGLVLRALCDILDSGSNSETTLSRNAIFLNQVLCSQPSVIDDWLTLPTAGRPASSSGVGRRARNRSGPPVQYPTMHGLPTVQQQQQQQQQQQLDEGRTEGQGLQDEVQHPAELRNPENSESSAEEQHGGSLSEGHSSMTSQVLQPESQPIADTSPSVRRSSRDKGKGRSHGDSSAESHDGDAIKQTDVQTVGPDRTDPSGPSTSFSRARNPRNPLQAGSTDVSDRFAQSPLDTSRQDAQRRTLHARTNQADNASELARDSSSGSLESSRRPRSLSPDSGDIPAKSPPSPESPNLQKNLETSETPLVSMRATHHSTPAQVTGQEAVTVDHESSSLGTETGITASSSIGSLSVSPLLSSSTRSANFSDAPEQFDITTATPETESTTIPLLSSSSDVQLMELSCKLHAAGISLEEVKRSTYGSAIRYREVVYRRSTFSDANSHGPFCARAHPDDDLIVDWKVLDAIVRVVASSLTSAWHQWAEVEEMESLPYGFEKAVFWKQPGLGKDWANLTGKWTYIYSFIDYHDYAAYNFSSDAPEEAITTLDGIAEAVGGMNIMILRVAEEDEIKPEDRVPQWLSGGCDGYPPLYFEGTMPSASGSSCHGHVRILPGGYRYWKFLIRYGGEDRWKSENVEIGGRGVYGIWGDVLNNQQSPCGPVWYYRSF